MKHLLIRLVKKRQTKANFEKVNKYRPIELRHQIFEKLEVARYVNTEKNSTSFPLINWSLHALLVSEVQCVRL